MGVECLRLLNEIIADFDEASKVPHKSAVWYISFFLQIPCLLLLPVGETLILRSVVCKDDTVAMNEASENTVQWSRFGKFFRIRITCR